MPTLIAAYKSDGTLIGRCDEHCYNAGRPKCTCICGGRNHGLGLTVAAIQSIEHADHIDAELHDKHADVAAVNFHCAQMLQLQIFR